MTSTEACSSASSIESSKRPERLGTGLGGLGVPGSARFIRWVERAAVNHAFAEVPARDRQEKAVVFAVRGTTTARRSTCTPVDTEERTPVPEFTRGWRNWPTRASWKRSSASRTSSYGLRCSSASSSPRPRARCSAARSMSANSSRRCWYPVNSSTSRPPRRLARPSALPAPRPRVSSTVPDAPAVSCRPTPLPGLSAHRRPGRSGQPASLLVTDCRSPPNAG